MEVWRGLASSPMARVGRAARPRARTGIRKQERLRIPPWSGKRPLHLGIVRKKDNSTISTLIDQALFSEIQKLEYSDMEVGKDELIGLQNIDFANELICNLHLAKQQ